MCLPGNYMMQYSVADANGTQALGFLFASVFQVVRYDFDFTIAAASNTNAVRRSDLPCTCNGAMDSWSWSTLLLP